MGVAVILAELEERLVRFPAAQEIVAE